MSCFSKSVNILIPPSPNWYCTNSVCAEKSGLIYAYATKNSIVIGGIAKNKIVGSVYCGIKSKPVSLVMFQIHSDGKAVNCRGCKKFVMLSTHVDDKLRIWNLDVLIDSNMVVVDCSVKLMTDSIKIRNGTNVVINDEEGNEVVMGDIHGEINMFSINRFDTELNDIYGSNDLKIDYNRRKLVFFKDEITALCFTIKNRVVVGYSCGRILVFDKNDGEIHSVLEHSLLSGSSILSLVEYKSNIWIGTNRSDYIFTYKYDSKCVIPRKLSNLRKGYIWTILSVLGEKLYMTCNSDEIFELDLNKIEEMDTIDCYKDSLRKIVISQNKKDQIGNNQVVNAENCSASGSNDNTNTVFCLKGLKIDNCFFLLGTTKSNMLFLINVEKFKLEWINNTLGGWISNIVSPYGYSHLVYIQTGDGKLMGMDMLCEDKVERIQLYDNLSYVNRGEKIVKISINYAYSRYISYLTSLGNIGILFINTNNLTHYSNFKIKTSFKKNKNIENIHLDWFIFNNNNTCSCGNKSMHACNLEYDENNNEMDEIDYNRKIYRQLLNEKYRHVIILFDKVDWLLSYTILFENRSDKRNIFESVSGEIRLSNSVKRKKTSENRNDFVEGEDSSGHNVKDDSDITILDTKYLYYKDSELIKSRNALYFSSVNKFLTEEGVIFDDEVNKECGINLFVNKVNFEVKHSSALSAESSQIKSNPELIVESIENMRVGEYILEKGERIVTGTVVLDSNLDSECDSQIFILATGNGNLLLLCNNDTRKKLSRDNKDNKNEILVIENIFREKNKIMKYGNLNMSVIVNNTNENYKNNSTEFMIAILNDCNKTSVFRVIWYLDNNTLKGENIIVRSNMCHTESLVNSCKFKSNLLWFRETRDFDIEYGNNFRLLIGSQEQILQVVNISTELMEGKSNLVMNKNSLLFLTNKSIHQQSNSDNMESLYNMLLLKIIVHLKNIQVVDYNIIYNYLNDGNILKYLFDFILFLNYNNSSLDLIEFHTFYHSKFDDSKNNGLKYKHIEELDEFRKVDKKNSSDYLIEYIVMLKSNFSSDLHIINNYLDKMNDKGVCINSNILNDSNVKDLNNDYILVEWLRYFFNLNNTKKSKLEHDISINNLDNGDIEDLCIVKSYVLKVLGNLERILLDFKNNENGDKLYIHNNENILHEYCVLSLFQGRIKKSIEMYCTYNLYQNAFLISNYYYGSNDNMTLSVLKRWLNYFRKNELYFQSFKCYIAMSDYIGLFQDLYKRIVRLVEIRSSYENIEKVFHIFKTSGYLNAIINLDEKSGYVNSIDGSDSDLKFNFNMFSIYMLNCYSMFYINYYMKFEIVNKIETENSVQVNNRYSEDQSTSCNKNSIKEFISTCNINNKSEHENALLKFKFDEINEYLIKKILLYDLMFGAFYHFVLNKWEYCNGLDFFSKLLTKINIDSKNKDDLLLYIKKYSYLPYEDQLLNTKLINLLKEFILLLLNVAYDKFTIDWMCNVENIIILSYNELFLSDDESEINARNYGNKLVVTLIVCYLNKLVSINKSLSDLLFNKEEEYLVNDSMKKRYQIIKYDLKLISLLLSIEKTDSFSYKFKDVIYILDELFLVSDKRKNARIVDIVRESFGYKSLRKRNKLVWLYNILNAISGEKINTKNDELTKLKLNNIIIWLKINIQDDNIK